MNVLDGVYVVAAVLTAPIWARKTRGDWRGRLGHAAVMPPAQKPRVLIHAVSVGEVNALRSLVPMLTDQAEVVISVGTDTGIARARELFEKDGMDPRARAVVVRYPLDFSRCVARFLDAVKPDAVGLVELELWPNFIRACVRRGIPVGVINGRLSPRSFKGYRKGRVFLHRVFGALSIAAVQDEAYAERFRAMGVANNRCVVTGSMKWDSAAVADVVAGADTLATELGIDRNRPLIVAGSTGPEEEALLHRACPPGVQLMCAPRKPERFGEAAAALPGCVRRSATKGGPPPPPGALRFLLDTIGELRMAYSLADVVVVGRSFGALYGSDPIEPIALGKPTVIGPRVSDFQSIVEAFDQAGAIVRTTAEDLPSALQSLMADPERRADLAARGRECIARCRGATARHAEILLKLARDRRPASGG